MIHVFTKIILPLSAALAALGAAPLPALSQPATQNVVEPYADLVELAESSPLVALAEVQTVIRLEGPQAANVPPGKARVYIEARGLDAYNGVMPAGQELRYLADLPLDARGKLPQMKKARMVLFARPVVGGNGEVQLIAGDAQLAWSAALETRLRTILGDLASAGAPPRITGVSMALYQQGDLVGEGETQIFLNTANGSPAAIIVQHKGGQAPRWSISYSEVVNAAGQAPAHDTLGWYRLACYLPEMLPSAANVSEGADAKDQALADYLMVRRDLGPCGKTRAL